MKTEKQLWKSTGNDISTRGLYAHWTATENDILVTLYNKVSFVNIS